MLQTLLVALLIGFALQRMGAAGKPILTRHRVRQRLVFRVLAMIMWAAPIGAFGAIAAVVGETGFDALKSLALLMVAFYLTCVLFVFVRARHGAQGRRPGSTSSRCSSTSAREFLLILATSSSESALPRLIAKMEHAGVDKTTVGDRRADRLLVQPRRHRDLPDDGVARSSPRRWATRWRSASRSRCWSSWCIASKGAAGVTGAGLATLAGGLQSHRPELVDGVGPDRRHRPVHVRGPRAHQLRRQLRRHRADRHWTDGIDRERFDRVLAGELPFDERTMIDDEPAAGPAGEPAP